MSDHIVDLWPSIACAAYGDPFAEKPRPRIVIVATRYQGIYEGGRFAALPLAALESSAFGQDCAAAAWWDLHAPTVGVGETPSLALADWYRKHITD
jgi:hypothetical protein